MNTVPLFAAPLLVGHDGGVGVSDPGKPVGTDAWHVATFRAEAKEDVHPGFWEMHPSGDEVVGCLAGGFRIHIRSNESESSVETVAVPAGTAFVVPRAHWHRVELTTVPSDMLAITMREGTQIEKHVDEQTC